MNATGRGCWGHLLCIHDRPGTYERRGGYWVLPTRLRGFLMSSRPAVGLVSLSFQEQGLPIPLLSYSLGLPKIREIVIGCS